VPPPRLRGRTSPRAPRRSRTSADGARRSRLASSVGPAVRHPRDTPPQGIREISRVRSASMAFLPGSRAPPVHLLGFVARTTRHAVCLRDPERARAEREQSESRGEQRRAEESRGEQSSADRIERRAEQTEKRIGRVVWRRSFMQNAEVDVEAHPRRWTDGARPRGGGRRGSDVRRARPRPRGRTREPASALTTAPRDDALQRRPRSPRPHATRIRTVRVHHRPTFRRSLSERRTSERRGVAKDQKRSPLRRARARAFFWSRATSGSRPGAMQGRGPSAVHGRASRIAAR
jgi:hypothetical protein